MEYRELKLYVGEKACCDYCKQKFLIGEAITVAEGGTYAFHYTDADGGCMINYIFFKLSPQRMLSGTAMVYREHRPEQFDLPGGTNGAPASAPAWARILGWAALAALALALAIAAGYAFFGR